MGVRPSQAVGAEDVEAVEGTLGRPVAEALQGRPDQDRATDPFVDETVVVVEGQAIGRDPQAEGLDLAGDGLVADLLVRGDPSVEGRVNRIQRFHVFSPFDKTWRPGRTAAAVEKSRPESDEAPSAPAHRRGARGVAATRAGSVHRPASTAASGSESDMPRAGRARPEIEVRYVTWTRPCTPRGSPSRPRTSPQSKLGSISYPVPTRPRGAPSGSRFPEEGSFLQHVPSS